MWKDQIGHPLNLLKKKKKKNFVILNYTVDYTLHLKLWISIQVNKKFDVRVQSVTRVIVYGAKYAFEMFIMQSVIWGMV